MTDYTKRAFAWLSGGVLALTLSFTAHADGFLSALPEVPLPEKISEIANSEVSFDAPTGRIIQIAASGMESEENILSFYQATLPQLGWSQLSATEFTREKEKLTLTIAIENGEALLQFELAPLNAEGE